MPKKLHAQRLEDRRLMVVDFDNPFVIGPGEGYEGVGQFDFVFDSGGGTFGTAVLLPTGRHVLTAAHNVIAEGVGPLYPEDILESQSTITFNGDDIYQISKITSHPGYLVSSSGQKEAGADIAIVELMDVADSAIPRHDIYRDTDEVGKVFTRVGFGKSGTGLTGSVIDGELKRAGQNRFDGDASLLNLYRNQLLTADVMTPNFFSQGAYLISDFDDGFSSGDSLGQLGIAVGLVA